MGANIGAKGIGGRGVERNMLVGNKVSLPEAEVWEVYEERGGEMEWVWFLESYPSIWRMEAENDWMLGDT